MASEREEKLESDTPVHCRPDMQIVYQTTRLKSVLVLTFDT